MAVRRALKLADDSQVSVTRANILVSKGEKLQYDDPKYVTPDEAAMFVKKYDTGQEVKPFSFEIEI